MENIGCSTKTIATKTIALWTTVAAATFGVTVAASPAFADTTVTYPPVPSAPPAVVTTPAETPAPAATGNTTKVDIVVPPASLAPAPAPVVVQPVAPPPATVTRSSRSRDEVPRIGSGLLVGGGFHAFSRDYARSDTDNGGYWNVRLVSGTRRILGAEAAYVGSAQGLNTTGLSNSATLMGHGAEGLVRLNLPFANGSSLLEPFGFVGIGWSRYHVSTARTTASVATRDDVMTVPYGAGLAFAQSGFFADARFTYRSTFFNDLLRPSATGSAARLDNWSLGGQLGFEF